ncbi:hypothetical protein Trydic_g15078 [Trypoxylus dichotomus]
MTPLPVLVGLVLMSFSLDVLKVYGMSASSAKYCNVWREIQPCSCTVRMIAKQAPIKVILCENMESFADVVRLLQDKFSPTDKISLRISLSRLEDLEYRSFKELNMTIVNLKLDNNDLRDVNPYSFSGLSQVTYLSLSDNPIPYIPTQTIEKMPQIATLDLGRLQVRSLREDDLEGFEALHTLVLPGNALQEMDTNSIPSTVKRLHLGRNKLRDLNGTLCHLTELAWLFINSNELTSLENQLPKNGQRLKMIHTSDNYIEKLPQDFKYLTSLETLFFHNNNLITLDGMLSKLRNLERVQLENNQLVMLQEDDFSGASELQSINLAFNNLTSLNNSVRPLVNLTVLNVTHNLMTTFSFEEIRGVTRLTVLDISHNQISHLTGFTTNVIDWESNLRQLRMDHNDIYSLNGSVSGFRNLVRLDVSHNKLTKIQPDDLIGLDRLNMLDISHNHLLTLEETSKTFLPALQELLASYNNLTILDKDFHGLPVLCWADLSHNHIIALGRDLVSKTHCRVHDGIHSDVWGVLKIDLQDNPILCDSALPEILSVMEINHTKITGVANCPTLSEQPVTTKRNNFLGYIGPEATSPLPIFSANLPHLSEPVNINPLYNVPYNPVPDISNQVKKSVEDETLTIHDSNDQQNQIQGDQPQSANFDVNIPSEEDIFVPIPEEYNPEIGGEITTSHRDQQPYPYQHQIFLQPTPDDDAAILNENISTKSLQFEPTTYAHYDQTIQERQINKLTSEIEELRAKLQELESENERLTHNLNQHNNLQNVDRIFGSSRPIIPLEQIPSLSTIKPPNEDFERTP